LDPRLVFISINPQGTDHMAHQDHNLSDAAAESTPADCHSSGKRSYHPPESRQNSAPRTEFNVNGGGTDSYYFS
jgi:hypothetical protein